MIDCYASERHFADHLAPVWNALPDEHRGDFIVHRSVAEAATSRRHVVPMVESVADPRRPVIVASRGDHKRVRQAGRPAIAYLEHGSGQSYGGDPKTMTSSGYPGGVDRDDIGLFMTPNEHSASRWRAAYPKARVEVVGCPKLEDLPEREGEPGRVVAISFHFECGVAPETRSAFPHYRRGLGGLVADFEVLGHGHPRALYGEPWLRQAYARHRIERVDDFNDVCRRADVYVADSSSTLFEFASTGRPVVVMDAPWFRRHVQHGLRFWDAASVGIRVSQPEELPAAVALALEDPPGVQEAREAALGIVYAYREGAAARAAATVVDWLEGTVARAA